MRRRRGARGERGRFARRRPATAWAAPAVGRGLQPALASSFCSSASIRPADEWNLEHLRERAPQRRVYLFHRRRDTEFGERGHTVLGDPARDDPAIMLE